MPTREDIMLLMGLIAIALVWAVAALVVVGVCVSAAHADAADRHAFRARVRFGRVQTRLVA